MLPPPDILEQASSAATALYKSQLISGKNFIDLTGGTGVDSWGFLQNVTNGIIVEENKIAAKSLQNNLPKLSAANIEIIASTAEEFIKTAPKSRSHLYRPAAPRHRPQKQIQIRRMQPRYFGNTPRII